MTLLSYTAQQYTYSAGVQNLVGIAGDNLVISGISNGVVRLKRISLSSSAAATQTVNAVLLRRSTPDTGGTATTLVAVPHDTTNPASQALVQYYTTAPTPGTQVGSLIRSGQVFINTAGGTNYTIVWDSGDNDDQPMTLRGTTQQLCLNFFQAFTNSPDIGFDIEWTESSN